jgi:hypothetical protein
MTGGGAGERPAIDDHRMHRMACQAVLVGSLWGGTAWEGIDRLERADGLVSSGGAIDGLHGVGSRQGNPFGA